MSWREVDYLQKAKTEIVEIYEKWVLLDELNRYRLRSAALTRSALIPFALSI